MFSMLLELFSKGWFQVKMKLGLLSDNAGTNVPC